MCQRPRVLISKSLSAQMIPRKLLPIIAKLHRCFPRGIRVSYIIYGICARVYSTMHVYAVRVLTTRLIYRYKLGETLMYKSIAGGKRYS